MLAAASSASKRIRASDLLQRDGRPGIVSHRAIAIRCFKPSSSVDLSRNYWSSTQVRSFVGVSGISTYPTRSRISRDGFSFNPSAPRRCPSLCFSIKGFLFDSSPSYSSSSLYSRVTRPCFPQPVSSHTLVSLANACFWLNGFGADYVWKYMWQNSTLDGRAALFSTSTKTDDGTTSKQIETQNQKTTTTIAKTSSGEQIADIKILRTLASYLWMKDNHEFRFRVIAALGFLVGAKVSCLVTYSQAVNIAMLLIVIWSRLPGLMGHVPSIFQVLNVQVPFLFKLAVDWLTTATGNGSTLASFTAANSTLLTLFATPAAVLIGYGIARSGASAFNGN